MLKEKEKRPNNKREDEVKTFKIGEREDAMWKERRAKIINNRLYMIQTPIGMKLHFECRLDCLYTFQMFSQRSLLLVTVEHCPM